MFTLRGARMLPRSCGLRQSLLLFGLLLLATSQSSAADVDLDLSSAQGLPGDTVSLVLTLSYSAAPVASAFSIDLHFDPNALENPAASSGQVLIDADKNLATHLVSPGVFRVAALGFNQNVIQPGDAATISVGIRSDALMGTSDLTLIVEASDPSGFALSASGTGGSVEIVSSLSFCGDGVVDPLEECDDGNTVDADGCSSACVTETVLLTRDDRNCINALNRSLARVTKARSSVVVACIRDAGKGRLTETIETCLLSDPRGKVAKATSKAFSEANSRCAVTPPIGATDAATVTNTATQEGIDLVHDIFGPDLDTAIAVEGFSCQLSVAKAVVRCQDKALKEFNRCKKSGLLAKDGPPGTSLPFGHPTDFAECMGHDPKGKIARACDPGTGKLGSILAKRCSAVDLSHAFPELTLRAGCGGMVGIGECLGALVACRVCRMLNAADGLPGDCDAIDDGTVNGSCP
jgi:cysteine-rich repeat protein